MDEEIKKDNEIKKDEDIKRISEIKKDNGEKGETVTVNVRSKRGKTPYRIIGTIGFKVWALIGLLICTGLLFFSIAVAIQMYEAGVFNIGYSEKDIIYDKISGQGWTDANEYLSWYLDGNTDYIMDSVDSSNIMSASISETDYTEMVIMQDDIVLAYDYSTYEKPVYDEVWTYGDIGGKSNYYEYQAIAWQYDDDNNAKEYLCYIVVDPDFSITDEYMSRVWFIKLLGSVRYGIFAIITGIGAAMIFLFVELMIAVGHSKGTEEVHPAFDAKFPFDLLTVLMLVGWYILKIFLGRLPGYWEIWFIFSMIVGEILLIVWCMSFASRIKNHDLGRGLLVTKVFLLILKLLKYVPLVWKLTLTGITVAALNTFLVFWMASGRKYGLWIKRDIAFVLWLVLLIAEFFALIYIGVMLKRLQKIAAEMADGRRDTAVNEKYMLPVFKEHALNLRRIQEGMNYAMEKKIKSEKMQAQLITNVSHDIKTPLTSIINYSDLISKEKCDNKKITEYAEVLGRQSSKLKRLLEDIVEASKASSGNLEVNCVPCTAGTLVSQAAGEYEERLEAAGLELIIKNAESETKIMADPRRMWRVFDNLLGNICKYAQKNTRVYLNIEEDKDHCYIIFKNTSAQELDINPDELMERFVRGDKSRTTEGNGLGMSIANNMVTLQGGEMRVCIDGDLFKVILEFRKYTDMQDE